MSKKLNILPTIDFDLSFNVEKVAGMDEVGRGSWAGPVVSAIVVLNLNVKLPEEINDSKKLSAKKREYLYNIITQLCEFEISVIDNDIIDKIGIGEASKLSMKEAFEKLLTKPDLVLIDGRDKINIDTNMINIIKGDTKAVSIAAASIIAKVTRDKIMKDMAKIYPKYNWDKNIGYGTKQHIDAISAFGVTPIHRKSFIPIKNFIKIYNL